MEQQRIPMPEKLAYAFLNFGQALLSTLVGTYVLYFFTDVYLLPAAWVSVLLFSVRIFDGGIDPFIGHFMDKRQTRLGKYRGYLAYWCLPFCLLTPLLFCPLTTNTPVAIVLATVIYYLWSLSSSMVDGAGLALAVSITGDARQRPALNTYKIVASVLATLLVSYSTLIVVGRLEAASGRGGYFLTALLFSAVALVMIAPAPLLLRERNVRTPNRYNLRQNIRIVLENKQLLLFLAMFFCHQIASNLKTQTAIYFFKYGFDRMDVVPLFMLFGRAASLSAQPVIVFASKRLRVPTLIMAGFALAACGMLAIPFATSAYAVVACCTVSSFGSAFPANLAYTYSANISDSISTKYMDSSFGAFSGSLLGLSSKFGVALGGGLVALVLYLSSYVPNSVQTGTAMLGIRLTFTLFTSVMYLTAGLFGLLSGRMRRQ